MTTTIRNGTGGTGAYDFLMPLPTYTDESNIRLAEVNSLVGEPFLPSKAGKAFLDSTEQLQVRSLYRTAHNHAIALLEDFRSGIIARGSPDPSDCRGVRYRHGEAPVLRG